MLLCADFFSLFTIPEKRIDDGASEARGKMKSCDLI